MKPVIQAMINLLAELSSGQDSAKITGYLHDLLIAIMHVEHWKVARLISLLAVLANLWDNEPPADAGRPLGASDQGGGGSYGGDRS